MPRNWDRIPDPTLEAAQQAERKEKRCGVCQHRGERISGWGRVVWTCKRGLVWPESRPFCRGFKLDKGGQMKPLVIYHGNCADGFGAAWAAWKHYGHDGADYYPGVYQDDPPDVTGRDVFFLDFSYKRPVILEMAKHAKSITIIDHHKSAFEDLVCLPTNVTTHFDMSHSGAMLAWNYFHPGEPVPKLICHIEDRDLWRFALKGTREIQAAVFSYPYEFEVWDELMEMDTCDLRDEGVAIERKQSKDINEFIQAAAYRTTIAGYDVPVLNAPYFWSSDAGHIMGKGEPFAACYWDTPDGRVFSLRSAEDGVDVSEVAKKFGGGGHKHAAGFRLAVEDLNLLRIGLDKG